MNEKISKIFKDARNFIGKHSPEILTGIGITGMITSTVLAVKATPKALELINAEKESRKKVTTTTLYADNQPYARKEISVEPELKPLDIIKVAWKPYIPSIAIGIASVSCIIGASAVNFKRNAALATAYTISERTLIRYRDKIIDTLGDKKDKEIMEKVAQDNVNEHKVSNSQVIITSKGNTLCMDAVSGRYFRSDIDKIKKIVNELNRQMIQQNYISLNEFYYEIGLDSVKNGNEVGWNINDGLIELSFSTCLAENDEPCVVIDYLVGPRYDFDKLM